jgi:NADPH-dependent ferric siderophore reductase
MIQPLVQTARRILLRPGSVIGVQDLTPRMRHIRLSIPSLVSLQLPPSQHVRINVKADGLTLRTYSIRRFNSEDGTIDLYTLLHGEGPGSQWASAVRVGDQVELLGPKSTLAIIPDAPYYLFTGEETAAVAIHSMLEALPEQAKVMGYLETTQPGEEIPYTGTRALPWLYRNDAPAATSATLIEAIRTLTLPDTPGVAYLAGEARTCQAIRTYLLKEKNWPRTAIRVKPFWTPGKTGLD